MACSTSQRRWMGDCSRSAEPRRAPSEWRCPTTLRTWTGAFHSLTCVPCAAATPTRTPTRTPSLRAWLFQVDQFRSVEPMPRCGESAYTLSALQMLQLSDVQIACLDAQREASIPIESPPAHSMLSFAPRHPRSQATAPSQSVPLRTGVLWLCGASRCPSFASDRLAGPFGRERSHMRDRTRLCSSPPRRCGNGQCRSTSSSRVLPPASPLPSPPNSSVPWRANA
jgi:hypothetical protein